jgi:uncharacterized protein with PIN domain
LVHLKKEEEMNQAKWETVKQKVEEELEKARKRALLADSFDDIEDIVVEMGQRVEQVVLAGVTEEQEVSGGQHCPECGARMKRKERKRRQVKSSVGAVSFERGRWVCPECGASVFPPGQEAEAQTLPPDDAPPGTAGV